MPALRNQPLDSHHAVLHVEYDGTPFHGWTRQPAGNDTVESELLAAFAKLRCEDIHLRCAGRTDAGVHGLMQVVHFDTPIERAPFSWVRGTNRFLPDDIAVQWAHVVPAAFHCRASALNRRYLYVLSQSPVRPSLDAGRVGWSAYPLDGDAMQAAATVMTPSTKTLLYRSMRIPRASRLRPLE